MQRKWAWVPEQLPSFPERLKVPLPIPETKSLNGKLYLLEHLALEMSLNDAGPYINLTVQLHFLYHNRL